ncbi:DUF1515 family protein [Breoghania sp.]|uniref:DUF1515 family protein n=1 Tax=Breoghania sp. TaxID=2065378 RepID=UPI002AABF336|nr:DUF1515 family protein [Breoghania sp.]
MTDPLHDIQRELGRLIGLVEGIKDDQEKETRRASTSRRDLHAKVDAAKDRAEDAAHAADAAKTAADTANAKIEKDIMPVIDEVRRWKFAGMTWLAIAGVAGASVLAFVIWAWDVIRAKFGG